MHSVKISRLKVMVILLIFLVIGGIPGAEAAEYPKNPVKVLVGFPPGGSTDVVTRALVEVTKQYFPQTIMVVNQPGGSSSIATAALVQSRPDGYTLGTIYSPAVVLMPLQSSLPYKGPNDLQPVFTFVATPLIFLIRTDAPWKTMQEVMQYAKANPGKIRVGISGIGTLAHLAVAQLEMIAGVDMAVVPFEGAAPSLTALLGGHIESVVFSPASAMGQVRAGRAKFAATWDPKRLSELPDTPTMRELGYHVSRMASTYFVAAPKGTPSNVIDLLYKAFKKGADTDSFRKLVRDNGILEEYMNPDETGKQLESEYTFYGEFIKKVKLQ